MYCSVKAILVYIVCIIAQKALLVQLSLSFLPHVMLWCIVHGTNQWFDLFFDITEQKKKACGLRKLVIFWVHFQLFGVFNFFFCADFLMTKTIWYTDWWCVSRKFIWPFSWSRKHYECSVDELSKELMYNMVLDIIYVIIQLTCSYIFFDKFIGSFVLG